MDRLWAPWRMEYIAENQNGPGCIFCTKPQENRDEENLVLYRAGSSFIILNAFPYNNGHLLVAPYRHIAELSALSDEEQLDLLKVTTLGCDLLKAACNPHGFNIGVNLGQVAGAGIADHLHIHIVPRWSGDTNFMPVIAETKVLPQALSATYQGLMTELRKKGLR
ncbi:MAG: HIT domain-containing protein [Armatimonadota bacterium]|nr:HIT domain-containing protein [Armatimonadota bacterium]